MLHGGNTLFVQDLESTQSFFLFIIRFHNFTKISDAYYFIKFKIRDFGFVVFHLNSQGWLFWIVYVGGYKLTWSERACWSFHLSDKIWRVVLIMNILVELLYHLMGPFILIVDLLQFPLLFFKDVFAFEILIRGWIDCLIISSFLEELLRRLCWELALMDLISGGILMKTNRGTSNVDPTTIIWITVY